MKTSALGMSILTLLSTASGQEPSPREQFQAAVAAYQKEKGATQENALKVIAIFKQLDPAPAVPEEAREPFIMGATVLKKASDPAGASKAVDLFTQAINVAPWFAEAYYNRALARETSGQFEPAMEDLKIYLVFKLADTERREAQDKIYSLKADAQLASAKKAEEAKAAAAKAAAKAAGPDFSGEWVIADDEAVKGFPVYRINRSGDGWNVVNSTNGKSEGVFVAQGRQLAWKSDHLNISTHHLRLTLSEDGQSIEKAWQVTQSAAQRKASGFTLQDGSVTRTRLKRK